MDANRGTFANRMLGRASSRRNLNGAVIDTTSEHLRRKHSVLRAIDDELDHKRNDSCTEKIHKHSIDDEIIDIDITHENDNSSIITSLSTAINDLDDNIKLLGICEKEIIMVNRDSITICNPVHPTLADITFNTTCKNNENLDELIVNNDQINNYETPKATRRYHKPNLESTRKSLRQELSEDKMSTPQIETTISTIQLVDSPPIKGDKLPDSMQVIADIPDEVEKFLENALGDELYNSTVTYADAYQVTNSQINASELMSESRTPFYKRMKRLLNSHSVSSRDDSVISSTKTFEKFDRTARLYRSLSQRVKKKLRGALSKHKNTTECNSPVLISELFHQSPINGARGERIEQLLRQVRIQQSIISQATKALKVCHSNKEFIGSPEEVESQRLLLLAYLRKRVMMEELKNLSSPDQQYIAINHDTQTNEYAEVQIDNFQLTLRKALLQKPDPGEIHEWYLVAVFEGTNVWASPAVPCPVNNSTIEFPGFSCHITKLTPKLKINVQVYILKLTTGIIYQHEEKYHIINGELQSRTCPSPTKFLKKVEHPLTSRSRHPIRLTSSFISSGYVELFLSDLIHVSPWSLSAVPPESTLLDTIHFKLNSKLHLSMMHQGFINYGDETSGLVIWNRKWCVVRGHTIMFWNYPKDQEDKKPPSVIIDLIYCVSEKISPVNRSLCAKPRTLLIETVTARTLADQDSVMVECRQGCTIRRHLVSCDSTRELVDWMSKLNYIVSILREWNINTANTDVKSLFSTTPMVSEL